MLNGKFLHAVLSLVVQLFSAFFVTALIQPVCVWPRPDDQAFPPRLPSTELGVVHAMTFVRAMRDMTR